MRYSKRGRLKNETKEIRETGIASDCNVMGYNICYWKISGREFFDFIYYCTSLFGSKYSVLPIPVRNHYEFKGWYTSTSDDGILIRNQDVVSMDFDHTLYAHWDLINVTDILIDKSTLFM